MNKIEKMIKELCPNGVEWKKLGCLATIETGSHNTNEGNSLGKYPFYTRGQEILKMDSYDYDDTSIITSGDGVGVGKVIHYVSGKYSLHQRAYKICPDSENLNPKFLFYYMQLSFYNYIIKNSVFASVNSIRKPQLLEYSIPVPPLPIQTEIVRILDKFVEQQEQLERLIELRKKQYEYYREEMLKPKEGEVWERKTLGEIGTFVRGNGLQKTDFTEEGFPCIHYGQVHTYYGFSATETKSFCSETLAEKLKKASYGDLIIATTSEDVDACCKATVWLGKGKVAISGDSYLFSHNKNPKFVAHLFRTKRFADQKRMVATGAKVVRVSGESMAKFEFQIPSSLDRQKEIADALDSFESSITALTSALESSKRRYEYYRDEMMRF